MLDKKIAPQSDMDYRIRFCQSYNLAVAMIAQVYAKEKPNSESAQKSIEYWQKYFYKKLALDFVEEDLKNQLKPNNKVKNDYLSETEINADLEALLNQE